MSQGRFDKLEKERTAPADSSAPMPSLEGRFGEVRLPEPSEDVGSTGRSGAEARRFETEPPPRERIRLLDLDQGQSFLRCCRCHADNYVTASRCAPCGADLETPEQRTYNEAFWKKRMAEAAEEEKALEETRARRAAAEREDGEAKRRLAALELELRRRRALGLPLDDEDDVSQPMRAVGRSLGRWLRRTFADRRHRVVVVIGFLVGGSLLLVLFGRLLFALYPYLGWRVVYLAFGLIWAVAAWIQRLSDRRPQSRE